MPGFAHCLTLSTLGLALADDNPLCFAGLCESAYSRCLVRFDPSSGIVKGWIDVNELVVMQFTPDELAAMLPQERYATDPTNPNIFPGWNIPSGIAYDQTRDMVLITGKYWKHSYHIRLRPAPDLGPSFVSNKCGLSTLG